MRGKVILGAVVAAGAAIFAATVGASLFDVSDLTTVPSANPKAAGYAPASQLSPELRQTLVAQGSTPLENPQGIVGWYGYENDAPSPDDACAAAVRPGSGQHDRGAEDRARQERLPRPEEPARGRLRTTTTARTSSSRATRARRRASQATSRGSTSTPTARTASRCWRRKDTTGRPDPDRSTASPGIRGRSGSCSRPRTRSAPTYAATLGVPSQVEDVSGALGRGGYEGIQNDSDGNIWIVEDIGGSNKPRHDGEAAEQLRLPLRPVQARRPAQRQAPGAAGAEPGRRTGHLRVAGGGQRARPGRAPHLRPDASTRSGSRSTTPASTAPRRSTRTRSPRRPTARRSSGRRTASSGRARSSASSTSTRPATRTRPAPRTATRSRAPAGRAAGRRSSSSASAAAPPAPASCPSSTRGTSRWQASTTWRSCRGT